jgi:hypothetical protein
MSAIQPPSERLWWKQPVHRVEIVWITIALIWCLVMFFMMPYWHVYGRQNLSTETYRVKPEMFARAAQEMVDKFTVRTDEASGFPVVAPPAGSDVYLGAREGQVVSAPPDRDGLPARLLAAAVEHQHPGASRLPARNHDHAGSRRHLCDRVQRILRHRPPPDGVQALREVNAQET